MYNKSIFILSKNKIINSLIWKDSEFIAKTIHKWQIYWNWSDYYEWHIKPVKETWKELALLFNIKWKKLKDIEILCDLHDAIEDTDLKKEDIEKLYWKILANDCEALSIKKPNWTKKTKTVYYNNIKKNLKRKITKAADRFRNISKIPELKNKEKALKLYHKYLKEHPYYIKYNIIPDLLEWCLKEVEKNLKEKWRL